MGGARSNAENVNMRKVNMKTNLLKNHFITRKLARTLHNCKQTLHMNMTVPLPSSFYSYPAKNVPPAEPSLRGQNQSTRLRSPSKHPQQHGFHPEVSVASVPCSTETLHQSFRSYFHSPPPNQMQTTTKSRNAAVFQKKILFPFHFTRPRTNSGNSIPSPAVSNSFCNSSSDENSLTSNARNLKGRNRMSPCVRVRLPPAALAPARKGVLPRVFWLHPRFAQHADHLLSALLPTRVHVDFGGFLKHQILLNDKAGHYYVRLGLWVPSPSVQGAMHLQADLLSE